MDYLSEELVAAVSRHTSSAPSLVIMILTLPLLQIVLERRYIWKDPNQRCLVSVDGTDFWIQEPWPFETKAELVHYLYFLWEPKKKL